jgi:hypothetical protein
MPRLSTAAVSFEKKKDGKFLKRPRILNVSTQHVT